ncbi:MAG: grasp-with-spasm system ATP-grasp peptide maturase [Vicingaceae bacterium]|nr:grasp-with-spasm system ATP-grasp peptide maturase [Vicingaceae bacterium]
MILILSNEENEMTTNEVIDWLEFYNQDYCRLNSNDLETVELSLSITNSYKNKVDNSEIEILFKNANVIWYRRWYKPSKIPFMSDASNISIINFDKHMSNEMTNTSHSLFTSFNTTHKKWVDYPLNTNLKKTDVIKLAEEIGLNVPPTIITNSKIGVEKFMEFHKELITKPITEVLFLEYKKYSFISLTKVISNENIDLLPDKFLPSLFQKNILKRYEIRTFFLNNTFYSMAIFSQKNKKTQNDFRDYDTSKPNRTVSYKLPIYVENKLIILMKKLNLTNASIDLIYSTEDNNYYFLEVNPRGQFGMVSKPCNYYLEKKVANYLKNQNTNEKKIN